MTQEKINIINGKIITGGRLIDGTIGIVGNAISYVGGKPPVAKADRVIDAQGNYISPGFIDIHVHGGGGHDFMDAEDKGFLAIAETHARFGTTAMMPTTLSSSREAILDTLSAYRRATIKNIDGAQFLGMHLEGPYFAMSQRGAQDPKYIRNPDPEEYRFLLEQSDIIKRWSAAPELDGALEFAKYARSKGVLVSMAHTDAVYEEAFIGFQNGYTLATHLYSGMSGVTRRNAYRYAGVVETALLTDEMDVEIIADGVHLPAPLLQLVYKIKGPSRMALITDAMRAAGMPPGPSMLGSLHDGQAVVVEDGVAKLPDRSAFAGSVATADRLVRTMIRSGRVSLPEAVQMITSTPAAILGIQDRTGTLSAGKNADIVIFNEDIQIQLTMIKGKIAYENR